MAFIGGFLFAAKKWAGGITSYSKLIILLKSRRIRKFLRANYASYDSC